MNTQIAVKIGTSRQVVIPKRIHDELQLSSGDYLAVERQGQNILFKPQIIGDRAIMKKLERGLRDVREGRVHGPFNSAKETIDFLHKEAKKFDSKKKHASRVK